MQQGEMRHGATKDGSMLRLYSTPVSRLKACTLRLASITIIIYCRTWSNSKVPRRTAVRQATELMDRGLDGARSSAVLGAKDGTGVGNNIDRHGVGKPRVLSLTCRLAL